MVSKKKAAKPAKKAVAKPAAKPIAKAVAKPAPKAAAHKFEHKHMEEACCCSHTEHCCGSVCGWSSFCPLLGVMLTRTFWIAAVLSFAVIAAFDMWWHGSLLLPDYSATAGMWRPEPDMRLPLVYAYQALLAMVLSASVLLMGRTSSWWGGFITGVLAVSPLAISSLMAYATMPFASPTIPVLWAVGYLLQGALVGVTVTAVARAGKGGGCCGSDCCCGK